MSKVLLNCEDLSFGYEGRMVLDGLNFSVEEGDKLCVVGENGSGKTTLLKGLLSLISPLGGKLIKNPELVPGDIGYLPQESPQQKDFPAAVFEVVLSGRQNKRGLAPFYTKADKAAAAESLSMLELSELKSCCFRELSGGQRRRVLLARSLCAAGKILLLDEPASGLDPIVQASLYNVLEKINAELGITVIMVSHDIEGVLRFSSAATSGKDNNTGKGSNAAGKVLHLAGKQLFFGSAESYRDSEPGKNFLGAHRHCEP
ncbi:MAG: metal ABC transporter ATP-binding protein [Treponema sp.]|nr:metal ABC transporter ATP-binding protein [Treponema sp.]